MYICSDMGKILKYLIPVLAALAFWGCPQVLHAYDAAVEDVRFEIRAAAVEASIDAPESEFCLPRQSVTSVRNISSGRRSETSHRSNIEFLRSGKSIESGIRHILKLYSPSFRSLLMEPSDRLVCLCRLII